MKKKGLPEVNELVLVTVDRVTPFAAWCELNDYEATGMIHISEVAGKWVYDIRNFVKEGKQYVARVMKVDRETNQVNLSLKRVSSAEKKEKMNEFRRVKKAEKTLEKVAEELKRDVSEVYEKIGIPLEKKFGDLFFAFETVHKSPEKLKGLGIPDEWVEALKKILERTFKEKEVTIKAEVEIKSYAPDGVEKVREVLLSLKKATGARVSSLSAPKYLLRLTTKEGKSKEKELVEKLEQVAKEKKYECEFSYRLLR